MNNIPPKIKSQLADDPTMQYCCIGNLLCEGKIEWHHVWTYSSNQIQEIWAIVGICKYHHDRAEIPEIKKLIQYHSLSKATADDLKKYPKKNWMQLKKYLKIK